MSAGATTHSNGASDADNRLQFGARLRRAREARRLSLGELSARCGLTRSFLSRVERDLTSPSVANLVTICDALSIEVGELFQSPQTTLVRRAERPTLAELPKAAAVSDTLLTPPGQRLVTVIETVAEPGAGGGELYTMPSECELCFVVSGGVEVQVDYETFTLEEGDALTFGGGIPHTWRAGEQGARMLWVLAPAIPDPQGVNS
jgi:transcriptional regulator with XRE-family HTH domain